MLRKSILCIGFMLGCFAFAPGAMADGIVAKIVCSPISATGTVQGHVTDINIYLQSDAAAGIDFMDPEVIGHGIAAGGRIEIEFTEGFERIDHMPITHKGAQTVNGTPQQGMRAKETGYEVKQGGNKQTIALVAVKAGGLPAHTLMSVDAKVRNDPVRQRGIKVLHVGLLQSAFINRGPTGTVKIRFIDGTGNTTQSGSASIDFLPAAVPQLHPTNFPDGLRNHNWQVVRPGETVGVAPGSLPVPVMLFERIGTWDTWRSDAIRFVSRFAPYRVPVELARFKDGIEGAGVLSRQQLEALEYELPPALARYRDGLIIRDTNGDGRLDPVADRIIGGVTMAAPEGATGQEIRSLDVHGAPDLSRPTTAYNAKIGRLIGGAIGLLTVTAGDRPGRYRPTLALLSDPDNLSSPDGASYTFTIVAR